MGSPRALCCAADLRVSRLEDALPEGNFDLVVSALAVWARLDLRVIVADSPSAAAVRRRLETIDGVLDASTAVSLSLPRVTYVFRTERVPVAPPGSCGTWLAQKRKAPRAPSRSTLEARSVRDRRATEPNLVAVGIAVAP